MKIEIWSDFVCPFCYIGKRHLEKALQEFSHHDDVEIDIKSYELDPNASVNSDKTIHESMAEKFGIPIEQAKSMNQKMTEQAHEAGLTYRFDEMQPTNSFDAHRLMKYAGKHGKAKQMLERLFEAYFTNAEHIGHQHTLETIAGDVGLDATAVHTLLQTDDYRAKVRADEAEAQQIGVEGVPFFVFNEQYAVSGAQPVDVFKQVLEQIWEEEQKKRSLTSLNPKKSKTMYCTDEGCCEIDE